MSNSTSNSTDPSGSTTDPDAYDPSAPVPHWHQNMELATICVANSLSLIIIIARVWMRRLRLKRFRKDDIWIAAAGVVLVFPHWVCQLGTNRFGSGLHTKNVPPAWDEPYWRFSTGWLGYYLVTSMIKVSVCYCLLEIVPQTYKLLRKGIAALCYVIMGLGISIALVWLLQCQPFLSNFVYSVEPTWCANIDAARYCWVALSVVIDIIIIWIPLSLIGSVQLKQYERRALMVVFAASLLGTITCLFGIYGIWLNQGQKVTDLSYKATVFVMVNDIEILMYTLGASATVVSKYLVSKAAAIGNHISSSRRTGALSSLTLKSGDATKGWQVLNARESHNGDIVVGLQDMSVHRSSDSSHKEMAIPSQILQGKHDV